MDPLLLRVPQAASMIGFSRALLYRLITTGELESIKVGAARRIPLDALKDWVSRQRTQC